ncbi:MAG: hypothetical protein QF616_07315, partial [Candidatus Marinimicrobia bacterium]|nr:hypothetical protein [Candidatus Neomarinimicrobiota bacterium]
MNSLILRMANIHKFIKLAEEEKLSVNELIDSAQSLLNTDNECSIHSFLEIGHLPAINNLIYSADRIDEWFNLLHQLILKSNFNVYALLAQRVERYGDKPLFQTISSNNITSTSYDEVWEMVQSIGSY